MYVNWFQVAEMGFEPGLLTPEPLELESQKRIY